jgi:hypothetical protein
MCLPHSQPPPAPNQSPGRLHRITHIFAGFSAGPDGITGLHPSALCQQPMKQGRRPHKRLLLRIGARCCWRPTPCTGFGEALSILLASALQLPSPERPKLARSRRSYSSILCAASGAEQSRRTAASYGQTLRLFKMTWENPEPDREIRTLDFRSEGKESAPFLIAITAE